MAAPKLSSHWSIATSLAAALGLVACGTTVGEKADGGDPVTGVDAGVDAGPNPLAITGLPTEQWTWVPIPGAICRDGSATGIGVSLNPASDKLMIFLEGGGACWNVLTCAENPSTFGAIDFAGAFSGGGGTEGGQGIFNRSDPSNPVADWSMVYIPYCTGDVHGGDNDAGTVDGVGPQQFVGYVNVGLDLQHILPTFPNVTEVLLTGASAGGFGAMVNYDRVQAAFGSVPVELLDDSGPPMSSTYVPACLQTEWLTTWGYGATLLQDCGADCPDSTDYVLPYLKHIVGSHADRAFGILDSDQDAIISYFYGFGIDDCSELGAQMPAATYEAGLLDLRSEMSTYTNFGLYTWNSSQHTSLEGTVTFDDLDAGISLPVWTAEIVDGGVTSVGP